MVTVDVGILKKAITYYGYKYESVVAMEECSELIQCISKELRGKSDIEHLTEEIADVQICLSMLQNAYGISDDKLNDLIKQKQDRMKSIIEKGDESYDESRFYNKR